MSRFRFATPSYVFLLVVLALIGAGVASAVEVPERSGVGEREFRHPDLDIDALFRLPAELPKSDGASMAADDLEALGALQDGGRLDVRGGRWATLILSHPLVPGTGVGNELSWEGLGRSAPADEEALRAAIAEAFFGYLHRYAVPLRLDVAELGRGRVTIHDGGALAQIYLPRVVNGVAVRDSSLNAVVNHGNLILLGTNIWGDIDVSTTPAVSADTAMATVQAHVIGLDTDRSWGKPELNLVPVARKHVMKPTALGQGYGHRLAWVVRPLFEGELGRWEALVDAASSELLAFEDTNQYAEAKGGVYPKTNDGVGQDGTEQAGWPMPWMDIGSATTDTGGNYNLVGSQTATFFGPYVNMADQCGTDSLTQSGGIDWGTSGGTDCTTPGFGGAGNTHASRSGFYELNRIKEMARSHLPSNSWLQGRLTANMNINNTCNAFWNGSTVNFYRSGGGCANTGEIAAVFDHEWGHGMDANDAVGGIASPSGEGIADIYSALRLYDSCIGRNFLSTNCSGNGDPCINCTGVRDIDYLQRQSGNPHDYTWSNANCGGSVHCVGGVYSEAVWSLWKRKLPTLYGMDNNTAAEIVTRLTYIGAGGTSTWFSGGPPNGGCGGSSGYMNYLAADDDNGNLNDGTPNMTAIYQAFNDQEIACPTPTVQDSGCAGAPSAQPNVTASPGNQQIGLSWGAVSGASSYDVFRAEGIFQCDFGKVKIGSTAGTSFNDSGLQNGRDYSYVVIPKSGASCFGPASDCDTVQPASAPDFAVSCAPSSLAIQQGNNDTSTCTVTSSAGYTGNVGLSCSGNPAGVSCSFTPASVSPPANGSADSTLTLTVSGGQATGNFSFDVVGDDGAATRTTIVSVEVIPAGSNGPQNAVYDAGLGAPKCAIAGSSCDSTTLVDSRDNLSPVSEPNQPNTLDGCADATSGTYHSDESNDRIVVSTLDGGNFTEGDTVEIAATVYAWSTGTSDTADFYWAADANSPVWNLITSIVPGAGVQTLTTQYVLPAGGMQAVRVQFRYTSTNAACSAGAYNDRDDLVFAVEPDVQCTVDADCDDGAYCNGAETCNTGTGQCEAGTAPACDDGAFCNGTESCNETTDTCDNGTAPCDPGTETCNETTDSCEPIGCTVDADCDDGLFCNGSETCDVGTGQCNAGTAPTCDDGAFCNGTETCNEGTDTCDAGTPPSCNDGVSCTVDTCDIGTDSCANAPNDALCDDGLFCNGSETCDAVADCQSGADPCPGQSCDEGANMCTVPAGSSVWVSFTTNTFVPGVGTVTDDDIVSYDETSGTWAFEFDGSDIGLTQDIDGFAILPDGDFLISMRAAGSAGGVSFDDSDVLRFNGTAGPSTSGTLSLYFDGSDVGLTSNGEDVDSVALAADGRLIVSTQGGFSGTGASGADEDLFIFTGTLGPATSGSFAKHFDGSDVGMSGSSARDVDAAGFTSTGVLALSIVSDSTVGGIATADEDVLDFAGTFGTNTSGIFSLRLDLSSLGISSAEDVDALQVVD